MLRRSWLALVVLVAGVLLTPPASAEPGTTVSYPAGAASTRYSGLAFDACTAPSVAALTAWRASPYRTVAIYFGGVNRTCAQPQLTASWVTAVSRLGWRLLPVYKGLQPSCGGKPTDAKISSAIATNQGTNAATDAAGKAVALGLRPGSAFYLDIENYSTTNTVCRDAVLRFTSGYVKELHRLGYVAGAYENLSSGAQHLSAVYNSPSYARPDAIWIARYDHVAALTGWAGIPDSKWASHQRAKQYWANSTETYGGVTINIDRDLLDAPVATVAYPYTVTSSTPLNARTGPSSASPVARAYSPGATVQVVCQAPGSKVGTTVLWDKLADGSYLTDFYVSTPSNTGYSAPLPRCLYPYQVAPAGVTKRSGPGVSYPAVGTLPGGTLAWITCQRPGSKVGTTAVWDRLDDGRWVSDLYVATPSTTTYSRPIPRC